MQGSEPVIACHCLAPKPGCTITTTTMATRLSRGRGRVRSSSMDQRCQRAKSLEYNRASGGADKPWCEIRGRAPTVAPVIFTRSPTQPQTHTLPPEERSEFRGLPLTGNLAGSRSGGPRNKSGGSRVLYSGKRPITPANSNKPASPPSGFRSTGSRRHGRAPHRGRWPGPARPPCGWGCGFRRGG